MSKLRLHMSSHPSFMPTAMASIVPLCVYYLVYLSYSPTPVDYILHNEPCVAIANIQGQIGEKQL